MAFRRGLVPLLALSLTSLLLVGGPSAALGGGAGAHDDHPDPGLSPSFALFPTPDDVQSSLRAHASHPWVTIHELGTSGDGRPLLLAEVVDPDSPIPIEDRVVTFLFTQQHGNEPAGTPAALQLLDDITAGEPIASTLSNQVLLVLPMANPDGALANQRANAGGTDINRDHIDLETPEANLIHRVLNDWDVHVAMDHHEYGGTGLGDPVPVRLYDYDLTTLYPVHGNVQAETFLMAARLMYDGIWPAAEADGFTANEYGEQTIAGIPIEEIPDEVQGPIEGVAGPVGQIAGGPDPGIMRNHLGLHNVAGLLVETRVDAHPNPFHDAERRAAIHSTVMEATLRYVHEYAYPFVLAKEMSAALNLASPQTHYHEGDQAGAIPAAWAVAQDAGSDDLFARHGLDAPLLVDGQHVHHSAVNEAGHVAAMLHPDSSRQVFDATVTAAVTASDQTVSERATVPAPAPALVLALLMVLVALAFARRRG